MQSSRTTVKRRAQRAHYDESTIHAILDETFVCTVSYVSQGEARCIPTSYARLDDCLILHGSPKAGWLAELGKNQEICITIVVVDGIVLDSTMLHHSLNYRSVVLFGVPEVICEPHSRLQALKAVIEHIVPGRSADLPLPSPSDLRQTKLISLPISEASAKIRSEGPTGQASDSVWCGEIPTTTKYGPAVAKDIPGESFATPPYVVDYRRPGRNNT